MALEKVGVEAVVAGLAKFQGDMKSINRSLQGVRGEGTLLQRAFGAIGESISNFGRSVVRIAEVALGVLLRDAIRAVIDGIRELVSATIESGHEFQTLEIRIRRMNFNDLKNSGKSATEAMKEATEQTKEQLLWTVKLAAKTPFDAKDIAEVFSLARTYGFASDEAKTLTTQLADFTGGMGLSNVELKRIIVNFGQMRQQGKLNARDLNDLGRGAFLPINRLLEITQEQLGLNNEEFEKMRKSGKLGAGGVEAFIIAFGELVGRDFAGGAEDLSKALKFAVGNVKDIATGFGALFIVKPLFDVLGKSVASFMDALTSEGRLDSLIGSFERIGNTISGIVSDLLNLLPSSEELADSVINAVGGIANWIENNRENIIDFFMGIGRVIREQVVPFVQEKLVPAFQRISQWVEDNREIIESFFKSLKEIAQDVFEHFFGGEKTRGEGEDFLDILVRIMEWVTKNKDEISEWIVKLADLFVKWQVVATILNIAGGIILSIVGFVLGAIAAVSAFSGVISFLGTAIGALLSTAFLPLMGAITLLVLLWREKGDEIKVIVSQLGFIIKHTFETIRDRVSTTVSQLGFIIKHKFGEWMDFIRSVFNVDWREVGNHMMQGIADGISNGAREVVEAARRAAERAWEAATSFLGIRSPSTLFMEIGTETMKGMAMGIQNASGLVAGTMQGAVAQVSSAAAPSVTNSTVVNNSNAFNLNINSSAPVEPIIQDFNMLQSLTGV
jgi:tape measure domain-containing protein